MAVLDDLVDFVSGNTADGSWQKPQLRQRCEAFLEDADIGGGGDMPDKVTVAMMESVEWPTIVEVSTEDGGYYNGDNIDEVLGINETSGGNNCSYMVLCDLGNPQPTLLVYMPFSEGEAIHYSYIMGGIVVFTMSILRHDVIEMIFSDATDRYPYDAESDTYIYDPEK